MSTATGLRWVAELSNYQFQILYRPGKKNSDADGLSRQFSSLDDLEEECTEQIKLENLSTVMAVRLHSLPAKCSERVDVSILQLHHPIDIDPVSPKQLSIDQSSDPVIAPVYRCVLEKRKPTKEEWKSFPKRSKVLMQQFSKLKIRSDDVLVRKISGREQLVLPEQYHQLVFLKFHEKMGHLGVERVEELSRQRFYWPYTRRDIEFYITKKCACIADKAPVVYENAPLFPIVASEPFEMVSIDFLKLDVCKGKFEHVLVVTDHFTRFAQAYATKNQSSKVAAEKLFNEFILQFGFPKRIHHDRGASFNSELFKELHRLAGIKVSNTTPYHPMGNGQCERFNKTLINMLKTIPEVKRNWKAHLLKLTFAYNRTANKTTGFSPYFLLFGRQSRLPLDCIFPVESGTALKNKTHDQFVRDWKKSMEEAFRVANQRIKKSGDYSKKRYDAKIKHVAVEVGDRVLLRNVEKGGTGKLRSCWERKIYEVIGKHDLVPVYTVRALGEQKTKTIHRNMMFKVNDLPIDTFGQKPVVNRRRPDIMRRSVVRQPVVKQPMVRQPVKSSTNSSVQDESGSSSDSGLDIVVEIPRCTSLNEGEGVPVVRESFDADSLDGAEPEPMPAGPVQDNLSAADDMRVDRSHEDLTVVEQYEDELEEMLIDRKVVATWWKVRMICMTRWMSNPQKNWKMML